MNKTINYRRRGAKGTLALSGPVGIFEAAALREAALGAMDDGKATTVCLDMREAQRLDVSALQILCALRREVQASGRVFAIEAVPSALAGAWEKIGCTL